MFGYSSFSAYRAGMVGAAAAAVTMLALLTQAAMPAAAQDIAGQAQVIDGDTIVIEGQVIDLFGIDAPELDFNGREQICFRDGHPYRCALIAAGRLAEKIAGRTVSCEGHSTNAEGRLMASCFIKKRENLSGWLVNKGFVVIDSRYSSEFEDWEIWNTGSGTGLWSGQFELPWLWRAQNE
ncbi:MAG: thermonuclease family protein [Proteobacteria bacterium]|nr:thermonuclease family protein [Pseudomonadota bacterium]